MNVRPVLCVVRTARRHRKVDRLRVPDDIRRMRHVRNGRLFDHALDRAKVLPAVH